MCMPLIIPSKTLIWEDYPVLWKESFEFPSLLRLEHILPGESAKTDTKKGCGNNFFQAPATMLIWEDYPIIWK